jgi:hypothetical protein
MAEESVSPPKGPKERSPAFPFIPLEAALRRLEQFETYFGRHPARADLAGLAWGMKGASSKSGQTLAALKYFGFVDYTGSGKNRTAQLTEFGRTFLRAQQESVKKDIIRKAALMPRAISHLFREWGADRPPDPVCLDELVLQRKFTDAAARLFLKVYDQTIAFAGLSDSDKKGTDASLQEDTDQEEEESALDPGTPPKSIKAGDLVQREVNGALTFPAPRRVTHVFHDSVHGWMVSVDGYSGAFAMSEIQHVSPAAPLATPPPAVDQNLTAHGNTSDPIETFLANGRLQINANVGLDGIPRLKQMLDKYEELLKLMNPTKQ